VPKSVQSALTFQVRLSQGLVIRQNHCEVLRHYHRSDAVGFASRNHVPENEQDSNKSLPTGKLPPRWLRRWWLSGYNVNGRFYVPANPTSRSRRYRSCPEGARCAELFGAGAGRSFALELPSQPFRRRLVAASIVMQPLAAISRIRTRTARLRGQVTALGPIYRSTRTICPKKKCETRAVGGPTEESNE